MKAEDYSFNTVYLRGYLAGLRHVAGNQYYRLLKQAGLEQYAEKYPDYTPGIAAKGSQIIALNRAIYETLGVELYNLYQRNLGREFARSTSTFPGFKEDVVRLNQTTTSNQEFLLEVFKLLALMRQKIIDEDITFEPTPDKQGVLLFYQECMQCAHLSQSDKPACLGVITYYKELFWKLVNRRFQVEEVYCGVVAGDRNCRFLIR